MYEENFKRIDTTKIYPHLLILIEKLIENCLARGMNYYVISGFRSPEEQDALFAKGRDKKGKVTDKSKVVTNAKAWQSNHNYSVAVDLCHDSDIKTAGLQPNWNPENYQVLAEEAQKLGLESGFYWTTIKDRPHVQLNLSRNNLSFADLKQIYMKNSKLEDIWAFLDKYNWP